MMIPENDELRIRIVGDLLSASVDVPYMLGTGSVEKLKKMETYWQFISEDEDLEDENDTLH